jgi:hypothetical protein
MESAVAAAYLASSYPTDVAKVKKWISATINSTVVYHAEEIYDPMLGEATSGQHIVVGVSNHPRAIRDSCAFGRLAAESMTLEEIIVS